MKEKVMNRVKEHYDYLKEKYPNYEIVYLALQGSQNYDLDVYTDEYISDIDTKAIILPNLENIVLNMKMVSETIILPNNEHIDVKDIRNMFENFKKQNINFIEILFTEYKIINPKYEEFINSLIKNREYIARFNIMQTVKSIVGMSGEKLKALQHPYPTIIDKINKYGYDPKQLHHIVRLNEFLERYINGADYEKCLKTKNKEYLLDIKKGKILVDEAVVMANKIHEDTKKQYEDYKKSNEINVNNEVIDLLEDVILECLKKYWKGMI